MLHPSPLLLLTLALFASLVGCTAESDGAPANVVPGGSGTGQIAGGAGDGGSGNGEGGVGGGILPCAEWPGPFGTHEEETLDPTLTWSGFEPGAIEPTTVELADYALCGGGKDVTAIVVYVDALWCSVCRSVAEDLADKYDRDWKGRGIRVVTLLVEDEDARPADLEATWRWRDLYGLEDTSVVCDPAYSLANETPQALPQALVIDPRSMRIVARHVGDIDLEPTLAAVIDGRTE